MKKLLNYLLAVIAVVIIVAGLILAYLVIADFQHDQENDEFNENGHATLSESNETTSHIKLLEYRG